MWMHQRYIQSGKERNKYQLNWKIEVLNRFFEKNFDFAIWKKLSEFRLAIDQDKNQYEWST